MTHEPDQRTVDQATLGLLTIAKQFRDAAWNAGRADVVARIDETILLLAGEGDGPDKPHGRDDKTNLVLRILDGIGF